MCTHYTVHNVSVSTKYKSLFGSIIQATTPKVQVDKTGVMNYTCGVAK